MAGETPLQLEHLYRAADAVATQFDADVYLYSGAICNVGYAGIIAAHLEAVHRRNCLLLLTTGGGDLAAGYQIARYLQRKYSSFTVCVPNACKSSGTLIAIGANKILMDEYSELGPISAKPLRPGDTPGASKYSDFDFLVNSTLELFDRLRSRIRRSSSGDLAAEAASALALNATCTLTLALFSRVDIVAAGEWLQGMAMALAYGRRLAECGGNLRAGAVDKLVDAYPSHEFIIDETEARTLFVTVERTSASIYKLIECIGDPVYEPQRVPLVRQVRRPAPNPRVTPEAIDGASARAQHRATRSPPPRPSKVKRRKAE